MTKLSIAVLGPGGVGGLLAATLARTGAPTTVVATESTVAKIERDGITVISGQLGDFVARPSAVATLEQSVDVLIIATKATALEAALSRIAVSPLLVLPLLNGLDHFALLRRRFSPESVLVGSIRVEAERTEPGVVVQRSAFLKIELATGGRQLPAVDALAHCLDIAGAQTRVIDSEALVIWGKLVRLNALACVTSAYDVSIGEILVEPQLRTDLLAAIDEGAAVAVAEGANIDAQEEFRALTKAHPSGGSSMQRDLRAGRTPELEAIPGAVLRAAARHGIACPTIERLTATIARRSDLPLPQAS